MEQSTESNWSLVRQVELLLISTLFQFTRYIGFSFRIMFDRLNLFRI